jgi:fluoroquinolone resistance protein
MDTALQEGMKFENTDFSGQDLFDKEYVKCEFINCNFSKSNLRSTDFIDCSFRLCDFSLAVMDNTGLKNVQFSSCKLMGINFSATSNFLFAVGFADSTLDYSSFFKKKMKKTVFKDCSLKEVDFEEADLSMAVFNNCDLLGTIFSRTNLEKADFRSALNYALDPEINSIKKAKFAYSGIAGLLAKYNIDIEYE